MRRPSKASSDGARVEVDAALATMSADDLREVVRGALFELDDRAYARVVRSLVARAARSGSGWTPPAIGDEHISELLAFVKASERRGQADPAEVDEHLRRGSNAFLRKDYAVAHRIFGALLPPVGDGGIDLGQHEMVDEVLGADTAECAAQYVVSAYMITPSAERAETIRAAIRSVRGVGRFWEPLREMERVAVEPLPGLREFLPKWRATVASKPTGAQKSECDTEEDRWLREVVQRLEGTHGLAQFARFTKLPDDLRAWCKGLMDAGDWKAALSAFQEAAELVVDKPYHRGEFLDGAAMSAQRLARKDLPAHFERAWRSTPSMPRLRRWLGSAPSKASLGKHISDAIASCPEGAACQRAVLHLLASDFVTAATLLAAAPGLGWSNDEHPGHVIFPLLVQLVRGRSCEPLSQCEVALEMPAEMSTHEGESRLVAPQVGALLALAEVGGISDPATRATVLAAMKEAAAKRVAGVTEQNRRRSYRHAAELVALCIRSDETSETARWAESLKANYRRYTALRAEFDRIVRS